jgi:hypothetical protein
MSDNCDRGPVSPHPDERRIYQKTTQKSYAGHTIPTHLIILACHQHVPLPRDIVSHTLVQASDNPRQKYMGQTPLPPSMLQ